MKLTNNGLLRINFRNSPYNDFRLQCNYKCSYCFQRCLKIKQIYFTNLHYHQTKLIWNELTKIEDKIMVRVNFNGETLIDKWAKKSAFYINKMPNVKVFEIITNNSVNPNKYINNLDLTKTSFNCSFHPEFISINKFIENILILKKVGCDILVNLICIPQIIKKLAKIFHIFKKFDINLKLQGFLTKKFKYLGKQYPRDYTNEERKILEQFYYSKEEFEYMVNLKRTKGLDCYAGVDMINIFLDGTVKRCFTGDLEADHQNKKILNRFITKNIIKNCQTFLNYPFIGKISNKVFLPFKQDTSVFDLISGKVKLKLEPYPCHEENCACYAHFIGLKEFRKKYKLSKRFVDNYDLNN